MKSYTKDMGLYPKFQSQFISISGFYDLLLCQDLPGGPKASQQRHNAVWARTVYHVILSAPQHIKLPKWELGNEREIVPKLCLASY